MGRIERYTTGEVVTSYPSEALAERVADRIRADDLHWSYRVIRYGARHVIEVRDSEGHYMGVL